LKKQILQTARFLVFLSIALFLLYLAFRDIDLAAVWEDLKHARYEWLLLTLPIGLLSHLFRAWRWNLLIEPLDHKPPLTHTFYAVMSGYLANLALPRMGEVVRCGSLTKTDKVPFDSLLGTVIVERVVDMITLLLLTFITFFIKIHFFGDFFKSHVFLPLGEKFAGLFSHTLTLALLGLAGIVIILLLKIFWKDIRHIGIVRKIKDFTLGIIDGIRTITRMQHKGAFLFSTILIWGMYFLTSWLVLFMLPETAGMSPVDGLFLLVVGSFGMVIPVQGGLGAYHWIVSAALTLYGISKETGLAVATLAHESQTLLILLGGAFSMIMVVLLKNKKTETV
jgi:uncharacterized protein (TIRG00374 family)